MIFAMCRAISYVLSAFRFTKRSQIIVILFKTIYHTIVITTLNLDAQWSPGFIGSRVPSRVADDFDATGHPQSALVLFAGPAFRRRIARHLPQVVVDPHYSEFRRARAIRVPLRISS